MNAQTDCPTCGMPDSDAGHNEECAKDNNAVVKGAKMIAPGLYVADKSTSIFNKPDQSDTLAKAQAKAAEYSPVRDPVNIGYGEPQEFRRCIFHHDVPANHGYEIKAGFVCFGHSGEFDAR